MTFIRSLARVRGLLAGGTEVVPQELRSRGRRGVLGLRQPDRRRDGRRGCTGHAREGIPRPVHSTRGSCANK